jgi:pilus assembly protein Flp/PilA
MTRFTTAITKFVRDEEGASMAEYALLLGVITVALITVITLFRNAIANIFNRTTNTLVNA